jgi:hypothetical protein
LGEKAREHIHPGRSYGRISACAQARRAETLIPESQRDGIKRHEGKEVPHRNLLEPVVELHRTRNVQVMKAREYCEGLFKDVLYHRSGKVGPRVRPRPDNDFVKVDDFLEAKQNVRWVVHMKRLISAVADDPFIEVVHPIYTNMIPSIGEAS